MEGRGARQQRRLLPRHRGPTPHLPRRARVPGAGRREAPRRTVAAHLVRRQLRHQPGAARGREAGRRVEQHAHRRRRQTRRALAQRSEAARVRVRQRRLEAESRGQQVQRMGRVRAGGAGAHRAAGAWELGRVPQHQSARDSVKCERRTTVPGNVHVEGSGAGAGACSG